MWFIQKYKNRILELEEAQKHFQKLYYDEKSLRIEAEKQINNLRKIEVRENKYASLMRESIGMQVDFSAADEKCIPPHFLEGLSDVARRDFISSMETIYVSEKFQKVVKFMINLFALNMVFRQEENERIRNQGAVVGFRTFLKELDKMHTEFQDYKKNSEEDFDPHAILPE